MPSFDLINTALEGGLRTRLDKWREQGLSYESIAKELDRLGYGVSHQTVKRWFQQLAAERQAS